MDIKADIKKIDAYYIKHRKWISIVFVALALTILLLKANLNSESKPTHKSAEALESFIPMGHTLVPIEILNLEQLKSIIDDRAIVDLFVAGQSKAVAQSVKLVQSPVNQNIFAVLIKDHMAKALLKNGYEFIVVVKNRKSISMPKKIIKKRKIHYAEEQ